MNAVICPSLFQVFTNPIGSPFHKSLRVIGFPGRRAVMVINDKTLIEDDAGRCGSCLVLLCFFLFFIKFKLFPNLACYLTIVKVNSSNKPLSCL